MSKKILLVEDDTEIRELLSLALLSKGYKVYEAVDGTEGYKRFKECEPDIIITDAMMPNVDGYGLVKLIRLDDELTPVIMLTALKAEEDELAGFDCGVNDYITKPFSIDVLVHRIEQQLSHSLVTAYTPEPVEIIEPERIVFNEERLTVQNGDKEVRLTQKEYRLLEMLADNSGKILSREQLVLDLWGENYYGDARNIDTHVKNLRRKLGSKCILTIKGVGYMYE